MVMEEKRTYERFDLKVPIKIKLDKPETDEGEFIFTTNNICAGGAFFHTEKQIPEGMKVNLDFVISIDKLKEFVNSQCRIIVSGEVIRRDSTGMAVRFEEDYEIIPLKGVFH